LYEKFNGHVAIVFWIVNEDVGYLNVILCQQLDSRSMEEAGVSLSLVERLLAVVISCFDSLNSLVLLTSLGSVD